MGRAGERLARLPEARECGAHGVADVEAAAVARKVAVFVPAHVPLHLVAGVESAAVQKAPPETECHRGVVGPFSGPQAEGAAANHVGERRERAARAELDGGTEGVSSGEAEKGASGA